MHSFELLARLHKWESICEVVNNPTGTRKNKAAMVPANRTTEITMQQKNPTPTPYPLQLYFQGRIMICNGSS